ncbi:hypothetical protein V6N12_076327 [Hibiscus sabdariffa]|uniref:Uncharacterized protein n=1 Tax=Hibiscus sabdariffa TaxID=183260 RepID=A0ABR2D9G9_9ROSI
MEVENQEETYIDNSNMKVDVEEEKDKGGEEPKEELGPIMKKKDAMTMGLHAKSLTFNMFGVTKDVDIKNCLLIDNQKSNVHDKLHSYINMNMDVDPGKNVPFDLGNKEMVLDMFEKGREPHDYSLRTQSLLATI